MNNFNDNQGLLRRVKEELAIKGITVAELERRCNLGNGTLRNWSKSYPSADKLQRVAKELGTTMDYLLTGKEENAQSKIIAREAAGLTESQVNLIRKMIKEFNENNL